MSVAAMSKAQERLLKQGLKNVQRAKTPEDVLGVDPGASEKEIKEAYREMSLLYAGLRGPTRRRGDGRGLLYHVRVHAECRDDAAARSVPSRRPARSRRRGGAFCP